MTLKSITGTLSAHHAGGNTDRRRRARANDAFNSSRTLAVASRTNANVSLATTDRWWPPRGRHPFRAA